MCLWECSARTTVVLHWWSWQESSRPSNEQNERARTTATRTRLYRKCAKAVVLYKHTAHKRITILYDLLREQLIELGKHCKSIITLQSLTSGSFISNVIQSNFCPYQISLTFFILLLSSWKFPGNTWVGKPAAFTILVGSHFLISKTTNFVKNQI